MKKIKYKIYKSLVYCNVIKFMKEKSLEFLLESWGAAGGPNIYRKAVPSCGTSNTVNDSKKPTLGWKLEVFE